MALPQGLVASGFFANVVLLSFDEALRVAIGTEIAPGILLADSADTSTTCGSGGGYPELGWLVG